MAVRVGGIHCVDVGVGVNCAVLDGVNAGHSDGDGKGVGVSVGGTAPGFSSSIEKPMQ